MAKRDYYDLLGVGKQATKEELKKAFRKKAMELHPDRNPGDKDAESRFKEVNEAYDVLSDDDKRAAYDRFGHAAFDPSRGGGGGAGGPNPFAEAGFSNFSDIFEEMFGMPRRSGGGQARGQRGQDLRHDLELELEEAFRGVTKQIRIRSSETCSVCSGSGAEAGAQPTACTTCGGLGRIRRSQGFFTLEQTCPTCSGTGKVIKNPCKKCQGSGRQARERTLSVAIPPGVQDGTKIRMTGEGEAGLRGSQNGDLFIFLSVRPHAFFQREENDLHCRVPIPMAMAALGGQVEVPIIDGSRVRVSIPAGTQNGAQFRLRGKGMSILHSSLRGDMYVEAQIEVPVNLTKRQRELLQEFQGVDDEGKSSPQSTSFFRKVRELWNDLTE